MLSDAGYGLIMLICTLLALKTIPMEKATKQMIKLLYYLSYPTIVWGALWQLFWRYYKHTGHMGKTRR